VSFLSVPLQVRIDGSFGEATCSNPVKCRARFCALPKVDRPLPACGIGRLNNRVLDTSVLHDRTSAYPFIQRAANGFGKQFLMRPMGYDGVRHTWRVNASKHQIS
jgi:hypothetical protein